MSSTVRRGAVVAFLAVTLTACGPVSVPDGFDDPEKSFTSINGGVHVGRDARVGNLQSVNGPISVESGSEVGHVSNVNGSVRLERGVTARSVQNVNGSITAENVRVDSDLRTVNGSLRLSGESSAQSDLRTINGSIVLEDSIVQGSVVTTNGDITLRDGAVVKGDLRVKNTAGIDLGKVELELSRPRVVVHAGASVEGVLDFEREVELWVHDGAKVGEIRGAAARHFSGDAPG